MINLGVRIISILENEVKSKCLKLIFFLCHRAQRLLIRVIEDMSFQTKKCQKVKTIESNSCEK